MIFGVFRYLHPFLGSPQLSGRCTAWRWWRLESYPVGYDQQNLSRGFVRPMAALSPPPFRPGEVPTRDSRCCDAPPPACWTTACSCRTPSHYSGRDEFGLILLLIHCCALPHEAAGISTAANTRSYVYRLFPRRVTLFRPDLVPADMSFYPFLISVETRPCP